MVANAAPTEGSLEAKIIGWLAQQGYPLEMLVAQSFQKADFEVIQSDFYSDVETGESREIDVIAYQYADYVEDLWIQISCCIECKAGQDKPWILFRPNNPVGSGVEFEAIAFTMPQANSKLGEELLNRALNQRAIQSLAMLHVNPVGYGLTQATFQKGKGPDVPYEAINSVVKASIALAIKSDADTKSQGKRYCHIIFPVIVIGSRLFECYLNDSEEIVINEIDSGSLMWQNPKAGYPYFVITLFTRQALGKLVQNMSEAAEALVRRGELLFDNEADDDTNDLAEDDIPF